MSSVKKNIIANFIGRFWTTLIGIVFVPVYIFFIGIEAYGLLGVFTTLQAILSLLDMGLSTTLNREVARHTALEQDNQYINNLVFTMERVYFMISVITGIVLIIFSLFFATRWVNTETLDSTTIISAFMLMAINFSCQFPGSLYQGGLLGLQKQISLNIILGMVSIVKAVGAILILWLVSPSIISFLAWQIFLSLIQLFFLRKYLWKHLPSAKRRPFYDKSTIRKSGKYASGIMMISGLAIILTQSDKIVLSNLVKLSEFGYYTLAATISGSIAILLFPVSSAVFPKMVELINKNNNKEFLKLFHQASQLISLIILPLGASLFIFSYDIIFAWTQNVEIARQAGPILQFLVIGSTINSLMTIPYQYTLSVGWIRFGINISIAGIIVFLPFIFFSAYKYGAKGGAFMWMVLNIAYFIFAMLYLFSRKISEERWKWYVYDNGKPMVVCIFTAIPFYLLHSYFIFGNLQAILLFCACLIVCYLTTLFWGTPPLRDQALQYIKNIRERR